jgi:ribonuclease E
LSGSIADELGPTSVPEATDAVADFDGYSGEPSPPVIQPETVAPQPERLHADQVQPEAPRASVQESVPEETSQEAERAARRRSTVREKVSFLVDAQPDAAAPVNHIQPEPSVAPAPAETAPEATDDSQPRRAGWWSRRFGNGE